jgi:hypothetical protein
MVSRLILAVTLLVVCILCLRILRHTKGNSLLAWYALAFAVVTDMAALFIESVYDMAWAANLGMVSIDWAIVDRIIYSLILTNLILVFFLLILERVASPSGQSPRTTPFAFGGIPLLFWPAVFLVALGLALYVGSSIGQLVIARGAEGLANYSAYYEIRGEMSNIVLPIGGQYIYILSLVVALPLLTLYSLQRFMLQRKRAWLILWLVLLATWVLYAIVRYQKSPIVTAAIANVVVFVFSQNWRSGRRRQLLVGLTVGGAGVLALTDYVYKLLGASGDTSASLQLFFERLVVVPMATLYNHFVVFPDLFPYLYYAGSRTLNFFLGAGQSAPGGGAAAERIASSVLFGFDYNMNTGIVGNGWAQWGYIGVAQGVVIVFGILLFWDILFVRSGIGARIPLAALIAFFAGNISDIFNVGMGNLLTSGLVFGPIFYVMLFQSELAAAQAAMRSVARRQSPTRLRP